MTVPTSPTRTPVLPGSSRWYDAPTTVTDPCTWIACDESGRDGDNLQGDAAVFCLGSVRITDEVAGPIVDQLATHLRPATELKWTDVPETRKELVVSMLLKQVDAAGADLSFVLMHNGYNAAAKMIDLLIEEHYHALGIDIYRNGIAPAMATHLHHEAPVALGERWTELLSTFISLHRRRHPKKQTEASIQKATVNDFYRVLDAARADLAPGRLADLFEVMAKTRVHAEHTQSLLDQPDSGSFLDPHQASIPSALRRWADPSRPVRVLHDDCSAFLTEEMLTMMESELAQPHDEWVDLVERVDLQPTAVGLSHDHPSLQLADLVAGAGRDMGLWMNNGSEQVGTGWELGRILFPRMDHDQTVWP